MDRYLQFNLHTVRNRKTLLLQRSAVTSANLTIPHLLITVETFQRNKHGIIEYVVQKFNTIIKKEVPTSICNAPLIVHIPEIRRTYFAVTDPTPDSISMHIDLKQPAPTRQILNKTSSSSHSSEE
jgi:hypothetical protein